MPRTGAPLPEKTAPITTSSREPEKAASVRAKAHVKRVARLTCGQRGLGSDIFRIIIVVALGLYEA